MPCARDELGWAGRPSQPSTFRIPNVSTLSLFNVKWMPHAPLPRASNSWDVLLFSLLPAWMLQAWMLQDAPNYCGTERRGYGVGGNAKRARRAAETAEQRAHRLWQRRERDRARCALQSSERRERAAAYARYQSWQTNSGDWRIEGGQASADEGTDWHLRQVRRGRPGFSRWGTD